MLADRPCTFFAGHTHVYKYTERNGRDYIMMGCTGAEMFQANLGSLDHVAWITMTDDGPIISNLVLNGILDKKEAIEGMQPFLPYRPRG